MTKKNKTFAVGILSALVLIIALVGVAVYAASDTNAHFTFTNIQETQPDLYVTKSVSSAVEGYTVPDTEFTFVLKWDQDGDGYLEFADSVYYFVYDSTGKQIMNVDEDGNLITSDGSFKTSTTGRFTLKDGQYAYFEWAGTVQYEITEETADGFVQVVPAGGSSASGTISAEGTVVNFENMYVPETDDEETMLAIRKDVSWPDGYEMPDIETEFTFEVKIDGELYANEPYTVYNADMTEELDRDTTDSNGRLTLKYDQLALFEEIEVGVDYEISEVDLDTGWRIVGTTEYHGSTVAPMIYAYFTNEGTAFIVEKDRADGITGLDEEFTFVLSDENDQAMSGITYYVYGSKGKLVTDEDGNAVANATDSNGEFTLKAGERAVFIGIAENSGYKITEAETDGYDVSPEDGYSNTVNYDDTEDYTFINTQLSQVTIKKAEDNDMSKLLAGAKFTLYGKDEDGKYTVEINSLTTGEDGTLTFTDIPAGDYMIKEIQAPDGYVISGEPIYVTLPYTMSEEEIEKEHVDTDSDEFKGLLNSSEGVYYFYELTYDVTNQHAMLELPNAGGFQWIWVLVGLVVIMAVGFLTYEYRKRRTVKNPAENHEGGNRK